MNAVSRGVETGIAATCAVVLLASCAAPLAAEVQGNDVYSAACSVGLVMDPDENPGQKSRMAALEQSLDWWTKAASDAPSIESVRDDDPHSISLYDDPIRLRSVVRALTALLPELPEAERGTSADEVVDVEVRTDSGEVLAGVQITPHPAGGYRVTQLHASGWTSDHPSCV